jgi:hypothetical protein
VSPDRGAALARRALGVVLGLALAAPALAETAHVRLRYGWAAGQVWRAQQSTTRETHVGDAVQREQVSARFEYTVSTADDGGALRLEARLLSQQTADGASPLDFSPIAFHARVDTRSLESPSFEVAEVRRPGPGPLADPIALRRVLRDVASAWRDSVLWFPELPERSLSAGQAFSVSESRELPQAQPGIAMQIQRTRSYRLLEVQAGVARFRLTDVSLVDASSGQSGIRSEERAEGEAEFDLALGMWRRQQVASSQRAVYSDASPEVGSGEASSRSVTEIRMERATPP